MSNFKKVYLVSLLFAIGSIFCFQSCENNQNEPIEVDSKELLLNLTSPNGDKIASSVLSLKEETSIVVAEKFGVDKDFLITDLTYIPVKEGYSVLVKYETLDGIKGGFIKTNNTSFTVSPDLKVTVVNKSVRLGVGEENTANLNGMRITCKQLGSCECIPTFKTNANVSVSYSCGPCNHCEMTIEHL